MSDQSFAERVASALVRESGAVLVFALLALPGLSVVWFAATDSFGFYLIAFVGAAGHVTLRRMSERDRSVETDLSETGGWKAATFLLALAVVGAATVSVRLGIGTLVGVSVTENVGRSLLAVLATAATLVLDYLLGERYWWASPSNLVACGVIWVLAALVSRVNAEAAESIQSDARRVDPM